MSTALLWLARENPWPGLVVASLNLIVALFLVGVSLLLGVAISLLAWLHALVDRDAARSGVHPGGAQAHDAALLLARN